MLEGFYETAQEIKTEDKFQKISMLMFGFQIVVGILTIIIAVLFLVGELGVNAIVVIIPAFVCCILASINLCIYRVRKYKK